MASRPDPKTGKRQKTGGRTVSTRNKATKEALESAKATGETPADILLRLARDAAREYDVFMAGLAETAQQIKDIPEPAEQIKAAAMLAKQAQAARLHATEVAGAAAPYFNPRLATVEATLKGRIVVGRRVLASGKKPAAPATRRSKGDELEVELEDAPAPRSRRRRPGQADG